MRNPLIQYEFPDDEPRRPAERRVEPCGTYGGYQRHRRAGEDACQPCKDATAAYQAAHRAASRQGTARQRATVRLRQRHPEEWRQLLREEQRRTGPKPLKDMKDRRNTA